MSCLFESNSPDQYKRWNTGANLFSLGVCARPNRQKVSINCRIGEAIFDEMFMIDTGAQWSVLNEQTVKIIDIFDENREKSTTYNTWDGPIKGYLERYSLTFISRPEWGNDLEVEGTFLVTDEWDGPNIIGYGGMLQHMRIALQPDHRGDNNLFFFAKSG